MVRLIHDGQLRLENIEDHSEDELRKILERCGSSVAPDSNKVCVCVVRVLCALCKFVRIRLDKSHLSVSVSQNDLLASLISLYTLAHSGLSTAPQPPTHLTAGKLSKVCPHKVQTSRWSTVVILMLGYISLF